MDEALLAIYVEDHVALAVAGIRLARRCAAQNRENDVGRRVEALLPALEDDRDRLQELARATRRRPSALKQALAILGELAGRLKLNGRLFGYSDLSRLEELEALEAGSAARAAAWRLLDALAQARPERLRALDFAARAERAEAQAAALERLRLAAGRRALLGDEGERDAAPAHP